MTVALVCSSSKEIEKRNKNKLQKAPIELLKRPAERGRRKYRLIVETVSVLKIIKIKKNYDNEIKKQKQTQELQKKKKINLNYFNFMIDFFLGSSFFVQCNFYSL